MSIMQSEISPAEGQAQAAISAPPIHFVMCVEAGGFEPMSIRAAQSLRKFGGRFAGCKITAVTPRMGVPLSKSTLASLDLLDVEYLNVRPANRYSWYPSMNKPIAMLEVQRRTDIEQICFIDSDMIVMGKPELLLLDDQTDLTICAPDKNIGSSGDEDVNTPFWRELCRMLGTSFEQLPWIHAFRENIDIRLYFNSGVFTFRRAHPFLLAYQKALAACLDQKLSSKVSDVYFHEQAVIGVVAVRDQVRWKALPHEYNYAVGRKIMNLYEPKKVQDGIILHYHDMMWPENWPVLMDRLKTDRPDIHDWLAGLGPLQLPGSPLHKAAGRLLKLYRKRKFDRFRDSCRVF